MKLFNKKFGSFIFLFYICNVIKKNNMSQKEKSNN